VCEELSKSKFASLTAGLIVRKGEAGPSIIEGTAPSALLAPSPARVEAGSDALAPRAPADNWGKISEGTVPVQLHKPPAHPNRRAKPCGVTVTFPPAEPETIGYFALKKNVTPHQLSHLMEEGCGNVIVLPVEIEPNIDRSIAVSFLDATENFKHDSSASGWVGDGGSFVTGDSDLFDQMIGWCLTLTVLKHRPLSVELRNSGRCAAVTLENFPIAVGLDGRSFSAKSSRPDPEDAYAQERARNPI